MTAFFRRATKSTVGTILMLLFVVAIAAGSEFRILDARRRLSANGRWIERGTDILNTLLADLTDSGQAFNALSMHFGFDMQVKIFMRLSSLFKKKTDCYTEYCFLKQLSSVHHEYKPELSQFLPN